MISLNVLYNTREELILCINQNPSKNTRPKTGAVSTGQKGIEIRVFFIQKRQFVHKAKTDAISTQ